MPVSETDQVVTLSLPNGSSAQVYLYGATVTSWKAPSAGAETPVQERLFVSNKSALDGSKPIRGGQPICFPIFGPPTRPEHKSLPQHGVARSHRWAFGGVVMDNDARVSVRFTLEPNDAIRSVYSHPFFLAYIVTLYTHRLSTDLHVENKSTTETLTHQALFHTYHACDAANVTVTPLKGLTYYDKTKNYAESVEERDEVSIKAFTDSVYKNAGGVYTVKYPGGGVLAKTEGFDDVVVWNPREEAGKALADMEAGGWDKFICVEPGMATYWNEIPPGDRWFGQQTLETL